MKKIPILSLFVLLPLACRNNPVHVETVITGGQSTSPPEYFPLAVGNEWSYSFYNFYQAAGHTHVDSTRGTSTWKVLSDSSADKADYFLIEETVNAVAVHRFDYGYASGGDTIHFVDAKFQFTVVDTAFYTIFHRILIRFQPDTVASPNSYLSTVFRHFPISHFADSTSSPDTLRWGPEGEVLTLVSGIGVVSFGERYIGNGQTIYLATLTGYSLN